MVRVIDLSSVSSQYMEENFYTIIWVYFKYLSYLVNTLSDFMLNKQTGNSGQYSG